VKRLALLLVIVLLAPVAAPVSAQNVIEDELAEIAAEIEALEEAMKNAQGDVSYYQNLIGATTGRMIDIRGQLAAAEAALADLNLAITETQAAISFTELEISQKEAELALTSANIADTHDMVVTQAVELFKRGGGQIKTAFDYASVQEAALALKYGSSVLEDTNRALDVLEELRNQEEQQVELIEEQKATLNDQLGRLATAQNQAETQRTLVEENKKKVEAELVNQQAALQLIKNDIRAFELDVDGLEAEQEGLIKLLEEQQSQGGIAPGELFRPLNPFRIVSSYGPRLHPILGYTRTHAGIDLDGDSGQEIAAAATGRIIFAGVRGGYGNTVIIDHGGGMATLYAHQSRIAVSYGQDVRVGTVIGYVGSTGLSTGPHLHLEVRINGAHTDPAPYFQ
jgi:murein DD-endopeptidase MepM/ murein hydrolase activator NlpD